MQRQFRHIQYQTAHREINSYTKKSTSTTYQCQAVRNNAIYRLIDDHIGPVFASQRQNRMPVALSNS